MANPPVRMPSIYAGNLCSESDGYEQETAFVRRAFSLSEIKETLIPTVGMRVTG